MRIYLPLLASILGSAIAIPAKAQIIPDGTLKTIVTPNQVINGISSDKIDGGEIRESNLFHSFQELNINNNRGVYFSNPTGVTNIFTRVTGDNPSNINGTLGVLGSANLFLLNPKGIIFGSGAKLDLQGSFLGTTASSINFADGTQFIAGNLPVTPLLTVSVPVGLGFGSNSGGIEVQSNGHNLTLQNYLPTREAGRSLSGLQVQPGKTLALIGGDITLKGGILTAPQGQIQLGSVNKGEVNLNSSQKWSFNYDKAESFGNIRLSNRALVDASGSGAIKVQAGRLGLDGNSIILIQNQGSQKAEDISINASESLELGLNSEPGNPNYIFNTTVGAASGGGIAIVTPQLTVQGGSSIATRTYSAATGGNLTVNASKFVRINPVNNTLAASIIGSSTFHSGAGGNVTVTTKELSVKNGGSLLSTTSGTGAGGNLTVNTSDVVEVVGFIPSTLVPSSITASTLNAGSAGKLIVNTQRLIVRDGGRVDSSTVASGAAGSVTVNAAKSVEVSGTVPGSSNPSLIISSANIVDASLQRILRLPAKPTGVSGDVYINTKVLRVFDGGLINVKNDGTGDAGTVNINARSVFLDKKGSISAATALGEGGNIFLRSRNLQMQGKSSIIATAGGRGTGGEIKINSRTITQLGNSDISANAVEGKGGDIDIITRGLFASPDSSITATSELGVQGIVNITSPEIEQDNLLKEQTSNFISAESALASSCLAIKNSQQGQFVVTGKGGIPQTPYNLEIPYSLLVVDSTHKHQNAASPKTNSAIYNWKIGDEIQEATNLVAKDGRLLLVQSNQSNPILQQLICK